jgi:outer membrane lipoprotein SlyB
MQQAHPRISKIRPNEDDIAIRTIEAVESPSDVGRFIGAVNEGASDGGVSGGGGGGAAGRDGAAIGGSGGNDVQDAIPNTLGAEYDAVVVRDPSCHTRDPVVMLHGNDTLNTV